LIDFNKILINCGDPAGIGPDLCVALAFKRFPAKLAVIGSKKVIMDRANSLKKKISFKAQNKIHLGNGSLDVIDIEFPSKVYPGIPDKKNSQKQIDCLKIATTSLLKKEYDGLVTLPVNKKILSSKKNSFIGHTEFIAKNCKIKNVVMMLATEELKVALATTHHSIKDIPSLITKSSLKRTINILNKDLKNRFNINNPKIIITGLNPHAGESGEFGKEEISTISPVIKQLNKKGGFNLFGPVPADTAFTKKNIEEFDAFLAMYHDQGLAPFKAIAFGKGVNITLGLPFVRTSVDHGTAYDIVGTKKVDPTSFFEAIKMAIKLS
jgi:4-hydroxythreonine-4-phosphate dehydrogenase